MNKQQTLLSVPALMVEGSRCASSPGCVCLGHPGAIQATCLGRGCYQRDSSGAWNPFTCPWPGWCSSAQHSTLEKFSPLKKKKVMHMSIVEKFSSSYNTKKTIIYLKFYCSERTTSYILVVYLFRL